MVTMDLGSVQSLNNLHDTPLPTPPEEKNAISAKRLSYVLGFLYSMFLIIFALLVYIYSSNIIDGLWSPIITLYIVISGSVILCVITVDVKLFTRRIRKQVEILRQKEDELELEHIRQTITTIPPLFCWMSVVFLLIVTLIHCNSVRRADRAILNSQLDAGLISDGRVAGDYDGYARPPSYSQQEMEHIEHNYCFARGRHAGSVYLKFGAAAFALGHFVHTILLAVMVHVSIALNNAECINVVQYIADILESVYTFVQLYFIFNYSNLIIIKNATLARIAFLHIMAGNICLWISTVTSETQLAYKAYEWAQIKKNNTSIDDDDTCRPAQLMSRIFDDYSAYLYPFTVEFNILLVGIFFLIWRNIGKCRHSKEEVQDFHHSLYAHTNVSGDVNSPHVLDIRISCSNAMGGLISSLLVIVLMIVSIIVGFVLGHMTSEDLQHLGHVIGDSMYLVFHAVMLVVAAVAFKKTQNLDINKHPVPWLDDVLLYICVPAFFVETMLTVIAVVNVLNVVKLLDTILMSLQMIVQIAFIIDGLRRCSNSRRLRRTKPGRELVLFLLVMNVCMWVMYTFSYKSPESKDVRYLFYGKNVWLAIGHLCTPIIMFLGFRSQLRTLIVSLCLSVRPQPSSATLSTRKL